VKETRTYGTLKSGKMKISYRQKFIESLELLGDCKFELIVRKLYKKHSDEQRGYYFAVIVQEYINGIWETQRRIISKEQAHYELKYNLLSDEVYNEKTGSIMHTVKSITTNTTVQQEEYHQRCREFIQEWFGVEVPLPNEQTELEFKMT
jgi:hypothetical protein